LRGRRGAPGEKNFFFARAAPCIARLLSRHPSIYQGMYQDHAERAFFMLYLIYLTAAVGVTLCSSKASYYIDLLDEKTTVSGAFLGGVLLSAVTSLPELFTSLSAAMLLQKPELCLGNILGSNLFNLAALALLCLVFYRIFSHKNISHQHRMTTMLLFGCYALILLTQLGVWTWLVSVGILLLYAIGVRMLSSERETKQNTAHTGSLTVKQIIWRFSAVSIGIIVLSIAITYLTDSIADRLHLGSGIAGALLLGIATSLPEITATGTLFRRGSMDIAVGNILGSNLFNFVILAAVDLLSLPQTAYVFSDPKTGVLLLCGLAALIAQFRLLKTHSRLCAGLILLSYLVFLVV
jgi:cation:H+ antiporter